MPADVVHATTIENENGIRIDQRRQPMRNDDQRATVTDAMQIGVDDRFAIGVERARRLVEDEDPRIDDQGARNR